MKKQIKFFQKKENMQHIRTTVLMCFGIFLLSTPALAQGGATVGKLNTIKTVISNIVNILFLIGVIWGLVKTVFALIGQKEGGMGNLTWLIGAIIVWVCFNLFMGDVGITSTAGIGGK